MDEVTRFVDQVGRLSDAEILRVAGQTRRRQSTSLDAERAEARRVVRAAGQEYRLDELTTALQRWASYNAATGELASDLSMRTRAGAYPVLADALLALLAGPGLSDALRDRLIDGWSSAIPDRFAAVANERTGSRSRPDRRCPTTPPRSLDEARRGPHGGGPA